jgi:hypothetical protein
MSRAKCRIHEKATRRARPTLIGLDVGIAQTYRWFAENKHELAFE